MAGIPGVESPVDVRALARAALVQRRAELTAELERERQAKLARDREAFRLLLAEWGLLGPDANAPVALAARYGDIILAYLQVNLVDYIEVGVIQPHGATRWSRHLCAVLADVGLALEAIADGQFDSEPFGRGDA